MNELITEAVQTKKKDGRLTCAMALEIADDLDVSPREVGEACDRLGIKIMKCQLGCFS